MKEAEAQREGRQNDATAQVAVFNGMCAEYQNNPEMSRLRIYYETMEQLMPDMKIIIDSGTGGTQMLLPLEQFVSANEAA